MLHFSPERAICRIFQYPSTPKVAQNLAFPSTMAEEEHVRTTE